MSRKYETNDSELLYLISENNEDANELFFEKYDNVIKMKATKYIKIAETKGCDFNDLLQEGRLGLTLAINNFKEQKNVKFSTFADKCIERQITSFLRNITRDKHEILNNSLSLETTTNTNGKPIIDSLFDDKNIDPVESLIIKQENNEHLRQIRKILSKTELEVFDLRLKGFSYKEISQLLGITIKSVDGRVRRIKNKISNIIKEEINL